MHDVLPLQIVNKKHRDEKECQKKLEVAKKHVRFCVELYRIQLESGRYSLHEYPGPASSWWMPEIVKLAEDAEVDIATCDMCAYGMQIKNKEGEALV